MCICNHIHNNNNASRIMHSVKQRYQSNREVNATGIQTCEHAD